MSLAVQRFSPKLSVGATCIYQGYQTAKNAIAEFSRGNRCAGLKESGKAVCWFAVGGFCFTTTAMEKIFQKSTGCRDLLTPWHATATPAGEYCFNPNPSFANQTFFNFESNFNCRECRTVDAVRVTQCWDADFDERFIYPH